MIGRRARTSRQDDTPSTRRKTCYEEAGLQGNGGGAPALVGVVVTWETGDEKVAGSQRSWTLRRILGC